MMEKRFVVLLSIFLSACSAVSQSAPTPAEEVVLKPATTPTAISIPTSTEIPPTISLPPTADPNFFRDDFVGALDPQWSWIRENPLNWSLTTVPGSLQINVGSGYVVAHSNSNLLLHPAPAGDFQIETRIAFRPRRNFQFAGLIVYESDLHFIQAGRGYCQGADCVGEGLYLNYYEEGVVVKPNFGKAYIDHDPILLRLSRNGNTYTFEASSDGKVWFMIGSHISEMNPLQIGLMAGQKIKGNSRPAIFDYFEVRGLP
ncbi:MAG: DUF1349 domain-containing protein [Chloroflexi bacterium]|nr:MAG: DUF1349 domain-containing protein [Chloroflexota bacterium]